MDIVVCRADNEILSASATPPAPGCFYPKMWAVMFREEGDEGKCAETQGVKIVDAYLQLAIPWGHPRWPSCAGKTNAVGPSKTGQFVEKGEFSESTML